MKPHGDYHPPKGNWVKFETLSPGDTFHDIEASAPGPVQYLKLETGQAASIFSGKIKSFDDDEFVFPVKTGWVAELQNYGFKFPQEVLDGGPSRIVAYVMRQTESAKANDRWITEVTKVCPEMAVQSFRGPERVIRWLVERVKLRV